MLLQENDLTLAPSGILVKDTDSSFSYSDGEASEQYLTEVLSKATDLSSASSELEAAIIDWPSEYHLSSKRANLLRGLNLPTNGKVLELGCGCGAITRYLGEQGFSVDAIEGSNKRAQIAALRCRGLDDVNIVCANFNDLRIPENTYDIVLLVGVIEYAARFWPDEVSEEEAVIRLLKSVRRSLSEGAVVIVAIENRIGFKYVLGAHEDHYAKRYVGIHGYPEEAGIKTYTQHEWSALVSASGFGVTKYFFPFPDYKVPTVLLSEDYTLRNRTAYSHIEGVVSRDYVLMLDLGVHEPVFWESASATKTIGAFANSYLILIGDNAATVEHIAENDFVHMPDFRRKRQYCVITKKRVNSNIVERQSIVNTSHNASGGIKQQLVDEPFYAGNLLSIDWSRSLLIDPGADRFKAYLARYYQYLQQSKLNIDLVPTNIVLDDKGDYRCFDQEWEVEFDLSPDYIYFRALMLFSLRHKPTLREFCKQHTIYNVKDFIVFGFGVIKIDATSDLADYVGLEENFQNLVNEQDTTGSISELLSIRFDQPDIPMPVYAKVYWKGAGEPYSEEKSVSVKFIPSDEIVRLVFDLPEDAGNVTHIRFDPCDEKSMSDIGLLQIPYLGMAAVCQGKKRKILDIKGSENVAAQGALSGIVFSKQERGEIFAVANNNPEIEFALDDSCSACQSYRVEVECKHIKSTEYSLVKDRFLVEEEILKRELNYLQRSHDKLKQEIQEMKSSKLGKLAQRYRSIRSRVGA